MPPSKHHAVFQGLNFTLLKENKKYAAYCHFCEKKIFNTAINRLLAHRRICNLKSEIQYSIQPETFFGSTSNNVGLPDTIFTRNSNNTSQSKTSFSRTAPNYRACSAIDQNNFLLQNKEQNKTAVSDLTFDSSEAQIHETPLKSSESDIFSASNFLPKRLTSTLEVQNRNTRLTHYNHDKMSNEDIEELKSKLGNFIFGCSIPFSSVESDHFKNYIRALRPNAVEHLPDPEMLSTSILDQKYEECFVLCKEKITTESVLLVGRWKNTSDNTKTIATMLHTAGSSQVFIDACDLSGEYETTDKLGKIVHSSVCTAKFVYNTDVYAVVSGYSSDALKINRTASVWQSGCSIHIGNLLAKDVIDENLTRNVQSILKEFKHNHFEKALLNEGGSKIKIPYDTYCCSHQDSYNCLIENLPFMKDLILNDIINDVRYKKIKPDVISLLFYDNFIVEVKQNISLLNPICELLNTCQDSNTSIADAADLWLNLKFPPMFSKFETHLQYRQETALNIYALTAYCLHPKYCDKASRLSHEQRQRVREFLLLELDSEGLESLQHFEEKVGVFKTLFKEVNDNGLLFWKTAEGNHKQLSELSLKLLKIPASSAHIEQLFSNCSYMQTFIRNRIDAERLKKLLHIYCTLNINDSDEY